jgi:very-short-patch-repair endonuclease
MSKLHTYVCHWCQEKFQSDKKTLRDQFHGTGRVYCCPEHGKAYSRKRSSETMAETNRKYASERMKRKNPMHNPKSREKMRTTLRAMGWKPPVRGGNGQPLPVPQLLLACALGWETEYPVALGITKINPQRLPACYKVDIANPTLKVAVEVDGMSHQALERRKQDRKKEKALSERGWTVLRFSNEEVMENLSTCVQTVLSTISKLSQATST